MYPSFDRIFPMYKSLVSRRDIRLLWLLTRSSVALPSRDCKGAVVTVTIRALFLPVLPLALSLLAIGIALVPPARTQDVPLVNVPLNQQKSNEPVEVEVVQIHRLMAIPDRIERSPASSFSWS